VRKFWALIAQTSAARIYWMLMSLVITTITARYLGPSGRGIYVAANAWVTAFSTFGYLSLSQVVFFIAAGKDPSEWLPRVLGTLLTILGIMTVAGWIVAATLYAVSHGKIFHNLNGSVLLIAFAALPFMMWVENGNGILMALSRVNVMNLSQIICATTNLIVTFILVVRLKSGVNGALASLVFAQVLIVAVSLGFIARQATVFRWDGSAARELLTGGAKLHLNAIGTYLFTQANVLILNNYRSSKETAYYQLALQLVTTMQLVPAAVSTVAYSVIGSEGPNAAWPKQKALLLQSLALMGAGGALAYFVAPFAIRLVFGVAFLPAVPLFRILLLGLIGMTMSLVMASQWIARGLFMQAAALTIAVGGATVLANFLAVPRWGVIGAAWVTVGTYSVSIVGNGIMAVWVERKFRIWEAAPALAESAV